MLDATERKVLAACAFVAALLCAFPRDFVSAGIATSMAVILYGYHLYASRTEERNPPTVQSSPVQPESDGRDTDKNGTPADP